MNRLLRSMILVAIGTLGLAMAVFAVQLGLDRSPGWGSTRQVLLFSGMGLCLLGAILYFWRGTSWTLRIAEYATRRWRGLGALLQQDRAGSLGLISAGLITIGVASYAVWYSSAGLFPNFPYIHNDYADLGDAFLHGQLALLEKPSPQLMALSNPYDLTQRENVPYRWDASYYDGRYYLYWGPVPAVVSAAVELLSGSPPSGALLVLPAYVGLLLVFFAFLAGVWRHPLDVSNGFSVGMFVAAAFINFPLLFQLGQARVYEASILYGQFFLFAGLLAWSLYRSTAKAAWLPAAGLAWALAVGCRYNLLISVVVFAGFALIWIMRQNKRPWRHGVLLVAPLLLGALVGGLYNELRFHNPFETGRALQLTVTALQDTEYSPSFVVSGLYVYLLYPLTVAGKFPFVKSALFDAQLLPGWLQLPAGRQFDHVVFGIVPAVPAVWLLALALPLIALRRRQRAGSPRPGDCVDASTFWMITTAAAGQILYLFMFWYTAERYVGDFFLLLVLFMAIVVIRLDAELHDSRLRLALWILVAALAIWTVAIGYFGAFSVPPKTLSTANPALYSHLASYWNDRYATVQVLMERFNQALRVISGAG